MSSPRAASGSSFLLTCHCENLISLPDPSVGEAGKVPSYSVIITEELGEWILWARSSFCHTFSTPEVFILLGFYLYYNVRRGLNFIVSCGPAYLLINPSISYCFVMWPVSYINFPMCMTWFCSVLLTICLPLYLFPSFLISVIINLVINLIIWKGRPLT